MPLFGRKKSKRSSEEERDASLKFRIRKAEEAEEIMAALQGVKEAEARGELPNVNSAVEAFFSASTRQACKRAVVRLRDTLLSDTAEHILVLQIAQSRNQGDEDIERLFEAHRDLLVRCRRDGIDAAFAEARRHGPDTYGWDGESALSNTDKRIQKQMKSNARFLLDFLSSTHLEGIPDDYSKDSLFLLDGLIYQLWGEAGPRLALEKMVNIWGSYLGCVLRENYKSEWIDEGKKGPALRLKGKSEIVVYPFGIMYKRLVNGSLDRISPKIERIDAAYHGS